jgi:hypothetical protein
VLIAIGGGRSRLRSAKLIQVADDLAQRVGHPYAIGIVALAKGVSAFLDGRWKSALELCDQASSIFREQCTGVAWELDTAHTYSLWSLLYSGQVAELTQRWPGLLNEAQDRGDLYAATNLSTQIMAVVRLGMDDPEGAQRDLHQAMGQWSQHGFHVQHLNGLFAQVKIDLYQGHGAAAWQRLAEHWTALAGSLLLRVQMLRIYHRFQHGSSALAAAAQVTDRQTFLQAAERDARSLDRENMPWSTALAQLIRAGVAAALGEKSDAVTLFTEAAIRLDAADLCLCAAAARRRHGELIGGQEGRALVAQANSWMAGQKIQNPTRMSAMYAPGRWEGDR